MDLDREISQIHGVEIALDLKAILGYGDWTVSVRVKEIFFRMFLFDLNRKEALQCSALSQSENF